MGGMGEVAGTLSARHLKKMARILRLNPDDSV
jgi:hypothetical protein